LKSLARDQAGLTGRKTKAETVLEQVERAARGGRSGTDALRGPVVRLRRLGPARLRGLDDPPARGVTAALESVRARPREDHHREWRMILPPRATGFRASGSG